MSERPANIIDEIRKALADSESAGGNMPAEILFVPKDGKKKVRFLSELNNEETIKVRQHDKFKEFYPQPCLKYYQEDCPFCARGSYRTKTSFVWTVWDYEEEAKKLVMVPATANSILDDLVDIHSRNATLKDRDITITRSAGKKSKYRARDAVQATEYEGAGKMKIPYTSEQAFKIMEGLIRVREAKASPASEEDDE